MESIKTLFKPPLITSISPVTGEWVVISYFDTPIKAILYDGKKAKTTIITIKKEGGYDIAEQDGLISLEMLHWPYQQHKFNLTWTETVPSKQFAESVEHTSGPYKGKKKYDPKSILTWKYSDLTIGMRSELVPTLHQLEIHPCAIEFTCKDGGNYVVVVQITVEVLNPIAAQTIKNFLMAVQGRVTEAIGNWGRRMTFADARNIDTDNVKESADKKIKIGDKFYLDVINDAFKEIGIKIPDVSIIGHFVGDVSADLIESEEGIIKAANADKAAVHEVSKRTKLNEIQNKENETEWNYQASLIGSIEDAMVNLQKEKTNTAKAYAGKNGSIQYLNIGNDGNQIDMGQLLASLEIKRKKGGNHAT